MTKRSVLMLIGLSGVLSYGMAMGPAYANDDFPSFKANQIISSEVELLIRKKAGTMIEKCVAIPEQYKVSFNYTSPEATLFSVHYHQGEDVLLAFDEELSSTLTSEFTTQLDQTYCFTWVNEQEKKSDGVISLEYKASPL
ncbi:MULTISPECIES: hypothetical protein [unclassified Shewanella]|uniref:hypothetical protein n=1 Tax=unclassified Shewanella TaxID=196818 RepID=UPI001BC0834E|nr:MULTISPECIES: hypothetical protein [unclassified Shewanella]GIU07689.1 hypothetical protein TUM4444_07510 [Shewanella sp. MBTL60-112-B1]GIU30298.1 hypothetical protein TUM4445_13500 [Shewanella sp. MBTL60-112-B2]